MPCEDPNAPLFFACHLEGEGTVSEDRNNANNSSNNNASNNNTKPKQDIGNIINAGANGLDSITGFIGSLTGKAPATSTTYVQAPDTKPKTSPWLIGGVIGGVVLLIALLILLKNGKPEQPST